jgi:RNA polymerase sigma-70 factor (ECF subfamily)
MPKKAQPPESPDSFDQARSGNAAAAEKFFERYYKAVYGIAFHKLKDREMAMDVTQEAFLKAFHYLHTLQREDRFFSWMTTIVGHICAEHIRKKKAFPVSYEPAHDDDERVEAVAKESVPYEGIEQKEIERRLLEALDAMPDHYRLPLTLRFLEGMKATRIAEILGTTPGSVRVTLHRGTLILREKLAALLRRD